MQIKGRNIYFDEILHKYTDDVGTRYTSTTTVIKNYTEEFKKIEIAKACERIGKNPRHPKFAKYRYKTYKQILDEWDKTAEDGCNNGNVKHNFLEDGFRESTGFRSRKTSDEITYYQLYTLDDVIEGRCQGQLDIDKFVKSGIGNRYPQFYNLILEMYELGYKFYPEIGVYDADYEISGLIDLFALHKDRIRFLTLDHKTNKDEIMFHGGYWNHDEFGVATHYIEKEQYFYQPLNKIEDCVGNKYIIQTSVYSYLAETFGFEHKGTIINHIYNCDGEEVNKLISVPYWKEDTIAMLEDHKSKIEPYNRKLILL